MKQNRGKPNIIAIVGPTASGKTSLSIELAKKFDGEIISADSRQVYRGLDIGSGKAPISPAPKGADAKSSVPAKTGIHPYYSGGILHHMLDVASPRRAFTVAQFQQQGRAAIAKILKKGKLPIIAGGTGLYVDSLIYNRTFPSVKPDFTLRKKLEAQSPAELFTRLKKLDPRRAATIDAKNPRRLIRALEIILATKKSVPDAETAMNMESDYDPLVLGIAITEKKLHENIHKRLIARMRRGMVREVENLRADGLSFRRLENFGLEYRYLGRYLRGKLTKQEMLSQLELEIRRYAKRQLTWFKREKNIIWVKNIKEADRKVKKVLNQ